jgi:hypothetical protein
VLRGLAVLHLYHALPCFLAQIGDVPRLEARVGQLAGDDARRARGNEVSACRELRRSGKCNTGRTWLGWFR